MAEQASKVGCSVDYDKDGKQHGYLNVPYSGNDSAWGAVRVPITTIKNGSGPTLLFTGGNHGDAYEGPIALMKLLRVLEPEEIQGRVIILPALNLPAVRAGTRLSPIDGANMNRVFPGQRDGGVTSMIAHYVTSEILPMVDAAVDIHSGGKTLSFLPCAVMHQLPDPDLMDRTMAALLAFGAPHGLVLLELDAEGMLDSAAETLGKVFISTELGGGGTASVETIGIADTGVRNLLCHFGLTEGEPVAHADRGAAPTRLLHTPDGTCFVTADDRGIYEVFADPGDSVQAGAAVGQIHSIEQPSRAPAVYHARRDGLLICRHHPGLVQPGDCLAVIAADYQSS